MPRPPKAKSAAKDSTANLACGQRFSHCIPRSLGEGGHLAQQTALRESAFLQSEASPRVVSVAKDNMAGFVLANGSMSSNQSGEGDIRRALIETDLVRGLHGRYPRSDLLQQESISVVPKSSLTYE